MDINDPAASEEWRQISEAPGYAVSNLGRVRGGLRGRILAARPRSKRYPYMRVHLMIDGRQVDRYIHRLVCAAFHGPAPYTDAEAHHHDTDKANNQDGNLSWKTVQQNRELRQTATGERHGQSKLTIPEVKTIRSLQGLTHAAIAARFGVARRTISDVLSERYWRNV